MTLKEAIQIMTREIAAILAGSHPTIYIFGSVVLDDFRLGWSDIDILVLTEREITGQQADTLVGLRQTLLKRYPDNPYFRLFEGGMLSLDAFLNRKNERTVYWGTSGQRITDGFKMDSFGMAELLDKGILICGNDIRSKMAYPTYEQMRNDVARHLQSARTYGVVVGWLLDIARGIYTVRTGKIIAKTAAGEWALKEGLCPDSEALQKTVQIRKEPQRFSKEDKAVDNAVIQRFADVLEDELAQTAGQGRQIAGSGREIAEESGKWYHGSPLELTELAVGSTITRWRKLAEAFSHKPKTLCYDAVGGNITHNGQLAGFLYVVDEPLTEGVDIDRHPATSMDDGVEWLTKRPLRVRKIKV